MNYERYSQERLSPLDYLISLPINPDEQDISHVRLNIQEGNSLAGSVAKRIVSNSRELMKKERELYYQIPDEIAGRHLFTFPLIEWSSYMRPSFAILNAESLLRKGVTFQTPEDDSEIRFEILDREYTADLWKKILNYDMDVEAQVTSIKVDWQVKQESLLSLLRENQPLRFIDLVTENEVRKYPHSDGKDIRKRDALHKGQERFKRLYTAGEMVLDTQ